MNGNAQRIYPMASDPDGNLVNYLEVQDERGEKMGDGLDVLAKDIEANPQFPPTLQKYLDTLIGISNPLPRYPLNLSHLPRPEPPPLPQEYPPHLPPHMERVLLNTANSAPSVTLNHLYACSIRDGVMALACTSRYRNKRPVLADTKIDQAFLSRNAGALFLDLP
ncbi:hypothetical protein BC829DRAFT_448501 [Chytridium lagenaria]|nr:hypothetical protein BC829DRAFT_448501 [Chytridium lagenaria]